MDCEPPEEECGDGTEQTSCAYLLHSFSENSDIWFFWPDGLARGAFAGSITGMVICSLLQLSFNELEVQRIKLVSKRLQGAGSHAEPAPVPKPSEPFMKRFMAWFGVKQVTREEYLDKLREERDLVWAEIQRLEQEDLQRREREGKS